MPYRTHGRLRGVGYVVLAAVAVVVLLGLAYLVGPHRDEPGYEPPAGGKDSAGSAGRGDDRSHRDDRRRRGDAPTSPDAAGGPSWFAGLPLAGDFGSGPHDAVITVTAGAGAAVGVKYAFRTGAGVDSGLTQAVSSWTASETVRGGEPLAGVIAQVASGTVSCTVRIDGRVTSHRTGSGTFATVTCAG